MQTRLIVARWSLGDFAGEELPTVACDLLAAGYDNQPLRVVAGLSRPTLRDAGETFERGMSLAGFTRQGEAEARRVLAWEVAHNIADRSLEPARGAAALADLWMRDRTDSDLIRFYAHWDEYGDHPEARPEIDQAVIDAARDYSRTHPEPAA